jgi:hypothetical protein
MFSDVFVQESFGESIELVDKDAPSLSYADYIVLQRKSNQSSSCYLFVYSLIPQRIVMQRALPSPPAAAMMVHFSQSSKNVACLIILSTPFLLQVISLEGPEYRIPSQTPICNIFQCKQGLGIHTKSGRLFVISHPLNLPQAVHMPITVPETPSRFDIVAIHHQQGLICIHDSESKKIVVTAISETRRQSSGSSILPPAKFLFDDSILENNQSTNSAEALLSPAPFAKKKPHSFPALSSPKFGRPQSPKPVYDRLELSSMLGVARETSLKRLRESISSDGASPSKLITDQKSSLPTWKMDVLFEVQLENSSSKDAMVSFSGDFGFVGGLIMHVLYRSHRYLSFAIGRDHQGNYHTTELSCLRDVKLVLSVSHTTVSIQSSAIAVDASSLQDQAVKLPITIIEYFPIKDRGSSPLLAFFVGSQRQLINSNLGASGSLVSRSFSLNRVMMMKEVRFRSTDCLLIVSKSDNH